ncbi:non-ribosomal peptide synthetase [Chlorella sorokiniana]|jgi:hypothetical protein|uniref:Non-ribosomal peptide synthetase n=1 Tax=Chlorella sorokiniana TaxID=3076 RepID=A0A2P6TM71_CHLSO|nr:non-ribosomal peptide synthetase [Chlorella sorokiniana]|eukprot:PRW45433.1 non-ribosomal peptide synthetase [Chlorella sorokiniana]
MACPAAAAVLLLLLAAQLAAVAAASARQLEARTIYPPDPVATAGRGKKAGGGKPIGTFTDPLPLSDPPSTTPWLSLAEGHTALAAEASGFCRYPLSVWASQKKLVLSYREQSGSSDGSSSTRGDGDGSLRPTQFAICPAADDYVVDMWLLTCERQITDPLGADVQAAGCSCQLADNDVHAPCPTGQWGWRSTAKEPRHGLWYYVVVLANPPDTGDEEGGRRFTIDVDRVPREKL